VTIAAPVSSLALVEDVRKGKVSAVARLISRAEATPEEASEALAEIHRHTGRAHIVGITGVPGSGKSTLIAQLCRKIRDSGRKVAVVAVDPTSPFSGGSILGDRVRMSDLNADPGVFIRSMATRGMIGGLSRATMPAVEILDAAGYDMVIIETVGVGQDEVDVVRAAHTTVVVSAPGLGDDIQAIKAGLLEVADVLVVNKADREGADRTERDLMHMLDLRTGDRKDVEIVRTIATRGTAEGSGITELAAAVHGHRDRAWTGEGANDRARTRASAQLAELVRALLADRAARTMAERGGLAEIAAAVVDKRQDPWTIAEELVATL
jgi:LAO/AO transport system kinase